MVRLAAIILVGGLALQQTDVFRSQANVTAVDVIVTDRSGRVVRSLGANDFVVTSQKRPRRVISADFVDLVGAREERSAVRDVATAAPLASSNRIDAMGRVFILAVDVAMIRAGEGRITMQQAAEFLGHLNPQDLVGLVSLPTGTPRVELTRDRAPIRDALREVVGWSDGYRSCGPTYGEAAALSAGDSRAGAAMGDRLRTTRCVGATSAKNVTMALAEHRMHTRALLDSLGAMADALRPSPGIKTIVLVAEGLFVDSELRTDITRLARRTEAAGARVYALHLDSPIAEASAGNTAATHDLDDHLGFDAMADVATATGGTAFRVIGSAVPRLDQIDAESSGYYALGVEVDPAERNENAIDLDVRTVRTDLVVRARRVFSPRGAPVLVAPRDTDEASITAAQLLQSPIAATEITLAVDMINTVPPLQATSRRYVMVASMLTAPENLAAIGFHLATAQGRTVAYKIESPVTPHAVGASASYLAAFDLPPGEYRLRFSCLDKRGARGSVERLFTVSATAESASLSEILLGRDNASPWEPIAAPEPGQRRMGVRVELAPATTVPGSTVVTLMIGRAGREGWIGQADLAITAEGATVMASGAINISQLTKGPYVLRVETRRDDVLAGSTAKAFDIR